MNRTEDLGIGLAIAQRLLNEGCSVMIADLALRPEAEATTAKYPHPSSHDGSPSATFHKTDVTNWFPWEATVKSFGRVDIVVNNAAAKDQVDAAVGSYHTFNVNTIGPIRLAQIAIDYWLQNHEIKGNLLWVSSMGAYIHSIQTPFYFASKAAILSVVKSLQGLKQLVGIRNSVICPGPTRIRDYRPQYDNGNALEIMMVGSKEAPVIHQKEVQLEALYPTASSMGAGTKAIDFMKMIAEKGMRSTC
ncbi:uncharacterized protein LY79DRAFT_591229 [Colletotrichum navitas]|uniref:Short-chain dehydrogenase n=1 Tax=Colletotrichum navitas TaxID=681940 RepID=A0AAD8V1V3_9PEZI|nr:uncharacterized protein LY79DRAFT_591229 [Colletotrichum navitas]KAK1585741.1 hypothetical protein LY79DRAFT_591229 [Colletotrichum navitas]